MFGHIEAVKNEAVEQFGIVVLYYEGIFEGKYPVIAITLCDQSLADKYMEYGPFLPENVLRIYCQLVSAYF